MNRFKMFLAKKVFPELVPSSIDDATKTGGGTGRELASGYVKRIAYKSNSDADFEDPDYGLEDIKNGYNTDSYIRQGVDKYVDQIFKEGYTISGPDPNVVDYVKLRLEYIAEGTSTPFNQFLIDIAEDVVKYANCMIVKARGNDPNALPQGVNIQGLYGGDPVIGYFCVDPVNMKCKRDKFGTILSWKQEADGGEEQEFKPDDVIHIYYKREKGNAYGTSFLIPVLDDVRALRQAEENVLKMMYRNIYPFYHVAVGTEDATGTEKEVNDIKAEIDDMDVEGGIVTTERVKITPIASDKVIDAEPYLKYMESRVFSGIGVPAIMFGRGNSANRSTGDNMTSEMADRIRAFCRVIEMFVNAGIIKELLMEGGYDPVLNPDHIVEFKFNDNDVDVMIKKQVHSIYKYEHNAITEDEMRAEMGYDPIEDSDRERMFVELITRQNIYIEQSAKSQTSGEGGSGTTKKTSENGSKETNNKEKNGGGSPGGKSSGKTAKKNGDSIDAVTIGLVKDSIDKMSKNIDNYIQECYSKKTEILQSILIKFVSECNKEIIFMVNKDNVDINLQDYITKSSVAFMNSLNDSLIGTNIYSTSSGILIDIIDVRVSLYAKSLIEYISDYKFEGRRTENGDNNG